MRRCHKIDVVSTPFLLFQEDLRQALDAYLFTDCSICDWLVLAVNAMQGASREENRTAPIATAYRRLFPSMKRRTGYLQPCALKAVANRSRKPIGLAGAGAQLATMKICRANI